MYKTSLNKKILGLALPAIVSNVTVPLLGLSDTAIAGHLDSDLFLAAMAVGATMMNLSSWLFGFLRMGTAGLSSNSYGARDAAALSRLFCRTLFIGLAIGILILILRYPLGWLLIAILMPGAEVGETAMDYYTLCVWGAPAQLAAMAMGGWMVGMQSTFWPMVAAVVTNAINIPLSLLMVFGLKWDFPGLATGTLCAQWIGCLVSFCFCLSLWRKFRRQNPGSSTMPLLSEWRGAFSMRRSGGFLSVNSSLFVRSAFIMGVSLAMTAFAGKLGEVSLAANAVMMQFFTFFSFFMDGFAHAAEALVGSAYGAGDRPLLRRYVGGLFRWAGFMGMLFTLTYGFWAGAVVELITDSPSVRNTVLSLHWILTVLPGLSFLAFIFDGFYIGLTRTPVMMWTTIVSASAFFALIWSFGGMSSSGIGASGIHFSQALLWIAFESYLFIRGIGLALLLPLKLRK